MSLRVGTDVLRTGDLERLSTRPWFLRAAYCAEEMDYAGSLAGPRRREYLAGRFAVKEAVSKLLGTGLFAGVRPREIQVLRDPSGEPSVRLAGAALERAAAAGIDQVTASLTHKRDLVFAVAVSLGPGR